MSRRKKNTHPKNRQERRLVVRGIRRDPPDIRKIGRALLALAQAEAERQAQAEHRAADQEPSRPDTPEPDAPGEVEDGQRRA